MARFPQSDNIPEDLSPYNHAYADTIHPVYEEFSDNRYSGSFCGCANELHEEAPSCQL